MTDQDEMELPRAIALAWGVAAAPQRGPKREMSVERIVEAAVAIADDGGLPAVSMAAVAARFDMTPMALYRYVSAKDDLVLLMFENGIGLPPAAVPGATWREALTAWAHAQLAVMIEHPWLLDVPIPGPPVTPNGVAWSEAGVAALASTGLSGGECLAAILAVNGQMRWQAVLVRANSTDDTDERALLAALITPDEFPAYHAALFADGPAADFSLGLAYLLDGIEAAAAGRTTPIAAPAPGNEPAMSDKKYREAVKNRRGKERELRGALREERQALREARERNGG